MEFMSGWMEGSLLGIGKKIKCMEEGDLVEMMEGLILEITEKIKNRGMEFLLGLMAGSMKVSGMMESSMEKACILLLWEIVRKEFGRGERD